HTRQGHAEAVRGDEVELAADRARRGLDVHGRVVAAHPAERVQGAGQFAHGVGGGCVGFRGRRRGGRGRGRRGGGVAGRWLGRRAAGGQDQQGEGGDG